VTVGCGLVRGELVARVRARHDEVERAILVRIRDDGDGQVGAGDAEYVAGLRVAVGVAVEHGLRGVELGEVGPGLGAVPGEALVQARRAARAGVRLDTVLRRYVLGSTVVGDFLMQEAEGEEFAGHGRMLREALGAQGAVLDRLLSAVTGEYARELEQLECSPEQRRVEYVQRLLAGGGAGDSGDLEYELEGWHVGVIATGPDGMRVLRGAAVDLGCRLLCLARGESTAWGWLGCRHKLAIGDVERACAGERDLDVSFVVGEPGSGLEGWRLTHRQAQAALRVAYYCPRYFTGYAEVALLAAVLGDAMLAGSLIEIYLEPLGGEHNGGVVLRETLRAYFAAERNASSAASALRVTRRTVENRLRTVKERLGWPLRTRQAELEIALRLEEILDEAPRDRAVSDI
jgi:PucR C-terminal helix-turn-helix domain